MYVPGGEKGRRLSVTTATAIGQNDAGGQELLLVELERESVVFSSWCRWAGLFGLLVGWSVWLVGVFVCLVSLLVGRLTGCFGWYVVVLFWFDSLQETLTVPPWLM